MNPERLDSSAVTAIGTLALDPQNSGTLYAATARTVYKSTDGAVSWTQSTTGLRGMPVSVAAVDPQNPRTLYANAATGAFKSTDGGMSWSQLNSISLLALDPQNPTTLYANGPDGFEKSTNAGATWSPANDGLQGRVSALAIDAQNASILYASVRSTGGGVWKSADAGASWAKLSSPPAGSGFHAAAIDPQDSRILYGWNGRGLFKSVDGGKSWSAAIFAPVTALVLDGQSTLYAAPAIGGMFKSTDGGASWNEVTSGLPAISPLVTALAVDPQDSRTVYAAINGRGVFRTTDSGMDWSAVNSGLTTLFVTSLAIDMQTPATVYAGTIGGVFAISFDR